MAVGNVSDGSMNSSRVVRQPGYPKTTARFNLAMALLSVWFIIGLFVDGAAHNHGAVDDSFFTPWHAILYASVAATGAALIYTQYQHVNRGFAWGKALPRGYFLSLVGVIMFLLGGILDLGWHEVFGLEPNIEALISPPHLLLAVSAFLFVSGPLRSAWQGAQAINDWQSLLPVLISILVLFSLLTFFTMYSNPVSQPDEFRTRMNSTLSVAAVTGILLLSILMMGCILPLVHRWSLPFGSLAAILGFNALLMFGLRLGFIRPYWFMVVGFFFVGLAADGLLQRWGPLRNRLRIFRFFAFALPVVYFLVYFVMVWKFGGLTWSIHMWLGVTFMTGVAGVLLSFLVQPPPAFADEVDG